MEIEDKGFPFTGQVIIEKGFKTRKAAENWMARMTTASGVSSADNVETHLWEPASPIGAREVTTS